MNPSATSRGFAPYVVILQSHHLRAMDTVIVAPLVRETSAALEPLDVPLVFADEALFLAVSEMGSVELQRLKGVKGNLADREDEIRRALDRIFTGF